MHIVKRRSSAIAEGPNAALYKYQLKSY